MAGTQTCLRGRLFNLDETSPLQQENEEEEIKDETRCCRPRDCSKSLNRPPRAVKALPCSTWVKLMLGAVAVGHVNVLYGEVK